MLLPVHDRNASIYDVYGQPMNGANFVDGSMHAGLFYFWEWDPISN